MERWRRAAMSGKKKSTNPFASGAAGEDVACEGEEEEDAGPVEHCTHVAAGATTVVSGADATPLTGNV